MIEGVFAKLVNIVDACLAKVILDHEAALIERGWSDAEIAAALERAERDVVETRAKILTNVRGVLERGGATLQ